MFVAFFLVNFVGNNSSFVAENATDYLAQQDFYNSDEMHAAAESSEVREKLHAAAVATKFSRILNYIGLILVFAGFYYLNREHNIFGTRKVKFRIRQIK